MELTTDAGGIELAATGGTVPAELACDTDLEMVAETLGQAFDLDPVARWVTPDPQRRGTVLRAFFGLLVATTLADGEVHVRRDRRAAALWEPPTQAPPDATAEAAFTDALHAAIGRDALRAGTAMELLAAWRPATPAWHLTFVGVLPQLQGRGAGTALLRPMLDRCDATALPVLLEASTADSRRLYERLGFEAVGEVLLPDGGPPVWPMWREPRTPGSWGGSPARGSAGWTHARGDRPLEEPP